MTMERVRSATASDSSMHTLVGLIESCMPEFRHDIPEFLHDYFHFKGDLYTVDSVILLQKPSRCSTFALTRSFVCPSFCPQRCHLRKKAKTSVFWPRVTPAIIATLASSSHCSRMAPCQPLAPPTHLVTHDYPFQCLYADYFHYKCE